MAANGFWGTREMRIVLTREGSYSVPNGGDVVLASTQTTKRRTPNGREPDGRVERTTRPSMADCIWSCVPFRIMRLDPLAPPMRSAPEGPASMVHVTALPAVVTSRVGYPHWTANTKGSVEEPRTVMWDARARLYWGVAGLPRGGTVRSRFGGVGVTARYVAKYVGVGVRVVVLIQVPVAVGDAVGDAVCGGVYVTVCVGEKEALWDGDGDGDQDAVCGGVYVGDSVTDRDTDGESVAEIVRERVMPGVTVGVELGERVRVMVYVGPGVTVGVELAVALRVGDGLALGLHVCVGWGVGVRVRVAVGDTVPEADTVGEGDGEGDMVGEAVSVGARVGVWVGEPEALGDCEGERVAVVRVTGMVSVPVRAPPVPVFPPSSTVMVMVSVLPPVYVRSHV